MMRVQRKTFTLIELLIVIAIIAILSQILLSALHTARNTANSISCANNTKTIMMGMTQYAEIYHLFPYRDDGVAGTHPVGRLWFQKIYTILTGDIGSGLQFYRNSEFFRCPSYYYQAAPNYNTIAYGKNDSLGSVPLSPSIPIRPNRVIRPSQVVGIGDSDDDAWYGMILSGADYPLGNRHGGNANISFVDGHSKTENAEEYLAPGVTYGFMDYVTGASLLRSSGSTSSWPLELLRKWGFRSNSYDYLTK